MNCRKCDQLLPQEREDPICFGCWYVEQTEQAHDRFAPLTMALARQLEVEPEVWQTGGMTFCLSVSPPGKRYAMFSEFDQGDEVGLGLYRNEEDEGTMVWLDRSNVPENAESIAAWAAPIILRFIATGETP